jgi:hypothetical protein
VTTIMERRVDALVRRFFRAKQQKVKIEIRNMLYELLMQDLISYVKASCKSFRRYETEQTIMSMTWDCYQTAMDTMQDVKCKPLTHFKNCCTNHIRNIGTKEKVQRRKVKTFDVSEIDKYFKSMPGDAIDSIMVLRSFYKYIPEEYREAFEDAMRGMDGMKKGGKGLPRTKYYEARRCFRWMIEFMMRGG